MRALFILFSVLFVLISCSNEKMQPEQDIADENNYKAEFPPFITNLDTYFEFSIGLQPVINDEAYQLKIHGLVDTPQTYKLSDLKKLKLYKQVQTIECIGNPVNGNMLATASWEGFNVYDLLLSLGLSKNARSVKYICADGYISTNTIDELKNSTIIGAIYMNLDEIPIKFGFPLRILNAGFYGIKNPGWVTEIEVSENEVSHYWAGSGWIVDMPMGVDTKIFFPPTGSNWEIGDTIKIGGTAFGGNKIVAVEYSIDNGITWQPAKIVKNNGDNNVWVFWSVKLMFAKKGEFIFKSRAIDSAGNIQPISDNNKWDGTNASPMITLIIK